jgi:hypothetical protein
VPQRSFPKQTLRKGRFASAARAARLGTDRRGPERIDNAARTAGPDRQERTFPSLPTRREATNDHGGGPPAMSAWIQPGAIAGRAEGGERPEATSTGRPSPSGRADLHEADPEQAGPQPVGRFANPGHISPPRAPEEVCRTRTLRWHGPLICRQKRFWAHFADPGRFLPASRLQLSSFLSASRGIRYVLECRPGWRDLPEEAHGRGLVRRLRFRDSSRDVDPAGPSRAPARRGRPGGEALFGRADGSTRSGSRRTARASSMRPGPLGPWRARARREGGSSASSRPGRIVFSCSVGTSHPRPASPG